MKKIIFTLLSCCMVYVQLNAQHCSTASGSSVCVPADTATTPGLAPLSDSLSPLINGTNVSSIIQFENFDTVAFGGNTYNLCWLKIDSIGNLPSGVCWSSSASGDTFTNRAYGCIALSGTACAPPGQYALSVFVTANISVSTCPGLTVPDLNGTAENLYYYIRVNNQGDTVTPVDTVGQSAAYLPAFKSYGEPTTCSTGISQIGASINSLSVNPNPFNSQTIVSFNSDKAEMMTEKLTNIIGSQVYSRNMNVNMGMNTYSIERGSLSPGVYFYTISDGKSVYTKRLIVTE